MNAASGRQGRVIPIRAVARDTTAAEPAASACEDVEEEFALLVYGETMLPEFAEGDVIIVEPDGRPCDGSYVVARCAGEWALRQLVERDGRWCLHALDARIADVGLAAWSDVRGVVIQKRPAGRRRASVSYV